MPPAPIAECEQRRLAALHSYQLLQTDFDSSLDRYTRLAAHLIGSPIAAVSFVDVDRQWFRSAIGTTLRETPRDLAFCAHAILGNTPLVVRDAELDPRFSDNPLVMQEPHIRFYAGAPLCTPEGMNIGTICTVDTKPREISPEQSRGLADLADAVVTTLELFKTMREMKRLALTDPLTDLPNRIQFFHALNSTISAVNRNRRPFSLLYMDCDHFKHLNDTQGHETGDLLLRELAAKMVEVLRGADLAARLGGDEFAVVLPETGPSAALLTAERLRRECNVMMASHGWSTTLSIGVATFLHAPGSADLALAQADRAMYKAKIGGRDRVHSSIIRDLALMSVPAPSLAAIAS
jgi:diguanylate cyclase (GGDEF)-like protein